MSLVTYQHSGLKRPYRTVVGVEQERSPDATNVFINVRLAAEQQAIRESGRMLSEIKEWTGWSEQVIAEVVDTNRSVTPRLLAGESRLLGLADVNVRRIDEAYSVVSRAYILAGRDQARTAEVLEQVSFGGSSARCYLIKGMPNDAYLAMVQVLRPPRVGGLMRGENPIDPRTATATLEDWD